MNHPLITIGVRAARAAGNVITRAMPRLHEIQIDNKQPFDFVTKVDLQAEEQIISTIKKAYPDHAILAEESGGQGDEQQPQWIIDPLDGTTNFLHGIPQFAVSIAIKEHGRLLAGIVYDPLSQDLYTTVRGQGAVLNGRKIRVSQRHELAESLIGTGLPFLPHHPFDDYVKILKPVMMQTAGVRRAGAAALDLAYVASGKLDGFWEMGLKPWDMAAGVLLIQEAGGFVTDLEGQDSYLKTGYLCCGNPKIHARLLSIIEKARSS